MQLIDSLKPLPFPLEQKIHFFHFKKPNPLQRFNNLFQPLLEFQWLYNPTSKAMVIQFGIKKKTTLHITLNRSHNHLVA